jgi:hypothetical protein
MSIGIFTEKKHHPSPEEITTALGESQAAWDELGNFLRTNYAVQETWKFMYGKKYGWALHFERDRKMLANFYPTQGAFTVQINLPESAVQELLTLDLPAHIRKPVADAFPFPEGRWIFIPYRIESDIAEFQRLIRLRALQELPWWDPVFWGVRARSRPHTPKYGPLPRGFPKNPIKSSQPAGQKGIMSRQKTFLALTALFLLAAACVRPAPTALAPAALPSPTQQAAPTRPPQPPTSESPPVQNAEPTPAPPAKPAEPTDSGWETLRSGLEKRTLEVRTTDELPLEMLFILRINPNEFNFEVAYQAQAKALETWLADSGALIALNGGYYRAEGEMLVPTGLTIVNGEAIGESYGDFAGMLAINETQARLRWLAQAPYNPEEPLTSALQSFPLLVKPGGEMGFPAELEDYQQARRTVIAQDRAGNFLLLVAPRGYFTLHQLSAYLVQSDLDLDIALNLDGGPSSGLLLADPPQGEAALLSLPVVILVYAR